MRINLRRKKRLTRSCRARSCPDSNKYPGAVGKAGRTNSCFTHIGFTDRVHFLALSLAVPGHLQFRQFTGNCFDIDIYTRYSVPGSAQTVLPQLSWSELCSHRLKIYCTHLLQLQHEHRQLSPVRQLCGRGHGRDGRFLTFALISRRRFAWGKGSACVARIFFRDFCQKWRTIRLNRRALKIIAYHQYVYVVWPAVIIEFLSLSIVINL